MKPLTKRKIVNRIGVPLTMLAGALALKGCFYDSRSLTGKRINHPWIGTIHEDEIGRYNSALDALVFAERRSWGVDENDFTIRSSDLDGFEKDGYVPATQPAVKSKAIAEAREAKASLDELAAVIKSDIKEMKKSPVIQEYNGLEWKGIKKGFGRFLGFGLLAVALGKLTGRLSERYYNRYWDEIYATRDGD
ncbi:MAG: hypothetical protein KJ600_00140 [Nanoarchaeota archaeon]|nr:hypothetical protein [Nanoarchaeota archaeon]MBU1102955.1 hypothetical protein [Nanoarchaeota archaeon]